MLPFLSRSSASHGVVAPGQSARTHTPGPPWMSKSAAAAGAGANSTASPKLRTSGVEQPNGSQIGTPLSS